MKNQGPADVADTIDAMPTKSLELTSEQRLLFNGALPWLKKITKTRMRDLPASIEFDDVYQAALIGLTEACQRHDASRDGSNFEAFAVVRVKGAMIDHLRSSTDISRGNIAFQKLVNRATYKLLSDQLDKVGDADLAAELGMSPASYVKKHDAVASNFDMVFARSMTPLSDHGDGDDGNSMDLADPSPDAVSLIRGNKIIPGGDPGTPMANSSSAAGIFVFRADGFLIAENTVSRTLAGGRPQRPRAGQHGVADRGRHDRHGLLRLPGRPGHQLGGLLAPKLRGQRAGLDRLQHPGGRQRALGEVLGRGISVVGGSGITIRHNSLDNIPYAAAILIARETSSGSYGVSNVLVEGNSVVDEQTLTPPYDFGGQFRRIA